MQDSSSRKCKTVQETALWWDDPVLPLMWASLITVTASSPGLLSKGSDLSSGLWSWSISLSSGEAVGQISLPTAGLQVSSPSLVHLAADGQTWHLRPLCSSSLFPSPSFPVNFACFPVKLSSTFSSSAHEWQVHSGVRCKIQRLGEVLRENGQPLLGSVVCCRDSMMCA